MDNHYINAPALPRVVRCAQCNDEISKFEMMAHTGPHEYWHLECFVCAQCFRPFNENLEYYEFGGRKYCHNDFETLFAPFCCKCKECIMSGKFVKKISQGKRITCYHVDCLCNKQHENFCASKQIIFATAATCYHSKLN